MHITHSYVLNVTLVLLTRVHVCNYKVNDYSTNTIKLTGSMHVTTIASVNDTKYAVNSSTLAM